MDIRALHRQGLTYAEIGRTVGHDVVGLLGHLTEVFNDAGMELRRELRALEENE